MVYVQILSSGQASAEPPKNERVAINFLKQDPVDDFLEKQTGAIKRDRDSNL
jgi:hypothetical protein